MFDIRSLLAAGMAGGAVGNPLGAAAAGIMAGKKMGKAKGRGRIDAPGTNFTGGRIDAPGINHTEMPNDLAMRILQQRALQGSGGFHLQGSSPMLQLPTNQTIRLQ